VKIEFVMDDSPEKIALKRLFSSLDKETAERYGRFNSNDLRFGAEEIVNKIINDRNEIGFIGLDDKKYYLGPPIGYVHINISEKESRRHSAGFGIVIHQDYQGQGYGELFMKKIFEEAKTWKVKKIWLHVYDYNKPAIKLYKKMGFKKTGVFEREEYKKGKYVDVFVMEKWL